MTRVHQFSSDGLASLFKQHQAKEAAEHGECSCPPNMCMMSEIPVATGVALETGLSDAIFNLLVGLAMSENEEDFDPEFDDESDDYEMEVEFESDFEFPVDLVEAGITAEEQLDQLGSIVENVTNLAGLYATMVHADRNDVALLSDVED